MRELILVSAYIDALPPTLAVMLRDDAPSNIKTAINLATSYDESRNFVLSNVDHVGSGNDRESRHGPQHNNNHARSHSTSPQFQRQDTRSEKPPGESRKTFFHNNAPRYPSHFPAAQHGRSTAMNAAARIAFCPSGAYRRRRVAERQSPY